MKSHKATVADDERNILKWMIKDLVRVMKGYSRSGWGPQDLINEIERQTEPEKRIVSGEALIKL